ncbi:ABC transporter ATP-binding protein [Streptomyces sp. NPDC059072]|uniref:ABC transporter ATP-binding protein n=1 Tax=Streptomyces sp. NPDC059072 TaxID=3346715 RepID=UPI00368B7BB5
MSTPPQPAPVISLRGVGLVYPGPPPSEALKPCDLDISPGEMIALVGPSGSGKSTFLNIVGLLDRPTTGTYFLEGVDTSTQNENAITGLRGNSIGFVFQSFHLLPHRTAADNVALALLYQGAPRAMRRRAAREALQQVGLGHRLHALPSRLSGGERQRVAIARAIASNPSILLCDEPTGNLDSHNAENVLTILESLHRQGLTIIVITHDESVAARCERKLSIRDGVLQEVHP